ncbi:SusE domain-containing protein [uncultured Bacteroides sp.]|uniref:SusE domain-containing protein n=1 Tax=uncultured Bacteroides sp. TaxID=162156 RepID=UPI0025FBDD26|nr:SusE domain-containing protein [uncultured Bacteroides sp.]
MKTRYRYLGVFIAACLFQACESDLDKVYYNDGQALPAVLEALPETYTIDKLHQDEVALTFAWSAPQVGYNASITNNLEMDIKGDNNFGDKKVVLSSTVGSTSTVPFTHKELNNQILTLLKNYADETGVYTIRPVNLEFRITSSISAAKAALVSKTASSTITPYDNENTGYEAAVITSTTEDELVLSADRKEETALTLAWQSAYLGDNASINYAVEMNLPEENEDYNWSKKVTVLTTKDISCNLTHQKLNDALISLLTKYGKEVANTEINLYISATKSGYIKALASEAITVTLTPYVKVPVLTTPESMDLTSTETYSLTWSTVEGADYQVEMDVTGAAFSQRTILEAGLNTTELSINKATVSKAIKYLLLAHEVSTLHAEQQIDFRIRAYFGNAETSVLSETKTVTVTYDNSEVTPANFYLIGEYCNWKHGECQKLHLTESGSYKGHIAAYNLYDGWKITDQANWDNRQWGAPINDGIMTIGGSSGNVTFYGGNSNTSYTVEFNPNDGRLTMSNEEKSWMLLGDHNGHAFNNDSKMAIVYDNNDAKWYLQKKDVAMQAGNTWQIRSQILNMEVTPQNIEGHFETAAADRSKFTVSQTGSYEVRWYFNEPTPYLIVIKE